LKKLKRKKVGFPLLFFFLQFFACFLNLNFQVKTIEIHRGMLKVIGKIGCCFLIWVKASQT